MLRKELRPDFVFESLEVSHCRVEPPPPRTTVRGGRRKGTSTPSLKPTDYRLNRIL